MLASASRTRRSKRSRRCVVVVSAIGKSAGYPGFERQNSNNFYATSRPLLCDFSAWCIATSALARELTQLLLEASVKVGSPLRTAGDRHQPGRTVTKVRRTDQHLHARGQQ